MTNKIASVQNNCLSKARGKQLWALQQAPFCEFRTWIMINIDLL
jgi:hypothetical protein